MRVGVVALLALAAVLALLYLRRHDTDPRVATRDTVPASAPAGQETTSARIDVPDGPGVAGRVLDEAWRPIAGAVVESDGARARSDAEGRFVLPAGTRRARVRATGYVTGSAYWDSVARAVEVVLARGGALAGTVRDAEGRPVAGAGVRAGEVEATADGDGRYSLPDLPAGFLAAMDVRAPGRAWQELARLPERPVRASETTAFDPVVETGVRVSGTAPPGATVVLEKDRARTRADAQGRFHFDGVTPGRYGLRLDPGPYHTIHVGVGGLAGLTLAAPPRATLEVRSARRPGTLRIAGNTWHASPDPDGTLRFVDVLATSHAQLSIGDTDHGALALPAGETTVFTIPPPELVFAGVIEAPDGSALAGAEVQVHDEAAELRRWGPDAPAATTDRAGRFRVEVRSSAPRFALLASHPDFAPSVLRRLEASSDTLRLRLGGGAAIEGTVRDGKGEPVPRALVTAHAEDPRWGWRTCVDDPLAGEVFDAGPPRESRRARADEEGRFRIAGLAPGTYWVGAGADEFVEAETNGAPVELILARDEGEAIAGIVVDARGVRVAGATVVAGPCGAMSDHAGRFRLEGLAGGTYDLVVKPLEEGIVGGPYFAATTVRGIEAGRGDVVVRVADGRIVRGRILDPASAPVAGAEVTLLPPPPPEWVVAGSRPNTPQATTDADGRYELRGLPAGPVELAAFRDGFLPVVFAVKGEEAEPQHLAAGTSISGVLLDARGVPAAGRSLRCSLDRAANAADLAPWRRNWDMYGPGFDTRTGDDGRFLWTGLPAGEYDIALAAGRDLVPVRAPSGTADLELRLLPVLTITGVVLDPQGRPVCRSGPERLKISAHHASGQVGYVPLAEDGSFRFDEVPQGRIRLHVIGWEDFESTQVEVEAGAQDVRLQLKPSRIR